MPAPRWFFRFMYDVVGVDGSPRMVEDSQRASSPRAGAASGRADTRPEGQGSATERLRS